MSADEKFTSVHAFAIAVSLSAPYTAKVVDVMGGRHNGVHCGDRTVVVTHAGYNDEGGQLLTWIGYELDEDGVDEDITGEQTVLLGSLAAVEDIRSAADWLSGN